MTADLEQRLRAAAGSGSGAVELDGVRARAAQIRHRRSVVRTASGVGVVILAVGILSLGLSLRQDSEVVPADTIPTTTANVEAPDPNGVLRDAMISDDASMAAAAIEAGADIEGAEGDSAFRPMHLGALNGSIEALTLLIDRGAEVDPLAEFDMTPLLLAISFENEDAAILLLDAGASTDHLSTRAYGPGAIHFAAANSAIGVIEELLERGVDVDQSDRNGSNASHWAAESGSADALRLLIESGIDLNVVDDIGQTPLEIARTNRRSDIVELLEASGARSAADVTDEG